MPSGEAAGSTERLCGRLTVAGDGLRARNRFPAEGNVEVADPVLLAQRNAPPSVPQGRLGPAQDRVDAGALPLPAGEVHRLPDLAPVVARGVGGVEHLVVLHRRPVGRLEQRPDVIEEVHGDLSLGGRVQRRRRRDGSLGHDRFLVIDGSVQPMDLPLRPGQQCGQTRPVRDEQALSLRGIGPDDRTNLRQREVELAKAGDQSSVLELGSVVGAVRRLRIDPCRDEQVELVVVAQRADAQAGQA